MNLHPIIGVASFLFLAFPSPAFSMCAAGILLLGIGLWAARGEIARARGLDKVVALGNLCFAVPLAVFGAEHFALAGSIMQLVPKYMPGRLFWTYFVGVALLAVSLSVAIKIQVRWSGLLFGIMMFLFVAMMDLPGTLANVHNRISWVLLCRELSFGAGGLVLAGGAMQRGHAPGKSALVTVGGLIIALSAMFYGVEHFLHPINVPGVPLEKFMPEWIPARPLIGYLTGAILFLAGTSILVRKKMRMAATYLATWILLLVVFIYGPILIASMLDPNTGVKVEGINYFADTLLYAGTILVLADATPRSD
ncbi:MAG TPA: hypothetical protein VMG82_13030 [Candidatus Sulfotelmatobacter sp.]|nr:hypothetical protein [Candidatus Sulfotelmatobacter sp.]